MSETDNEIPIEAWNTILFDKFCRFRDIVSSGLSPYSSAVLARRPYAPGSRVLDVGCGFGETTLEIGGLVAPGGEAVGVDCAANFINLARDEAAEAGVDNAVFRVADVQTDDLGGPYDHAFSRFGTMFFNLPGAALRNIRRSLKPGGTLTMIVWRKKEDNPWVHEAERLAQSMVPIVSHEETDQIHCGPGPFSMAGADMVSDLLRISGYEQIRFERHDADIRIGKSLDEAVEFGMALGPAGEIIRLAGDEGVQLRPQLETAFKSMLSQYQRDDGVWGRSSGWFVTAVNPG